MADRSISVLLPTYEPDPVFLRETLESLLRQMEGGWTCVIRDDASERDVEAMVETYLTDPRISFVRNECRLGIGGNWNACLKEADAPFIQFLFQDDTWDPRYLESSADTLEAHPTAGFVATEHAYACERGIETARGYGSLRKEKRRLLASGLHDGSAFLRWWLARGLEPNLIGEPCFVMLRRSVVDKAGPFDEELTQLLDVEYWVRMLRHGDFYYLPDELGTFRVHRNAASFQNRDFDIAFRETIECLRKISPLFPVGSEERTLLQKRADDSFVKVIAHVVNKVIRFRPVGKGSAPYLRYFLRHPNVAAIAFFRYAVDACRRWRRKFLANNFFHLHAPFFWLE